MSPFRRIPLVMTACCLALSLHPLAREAKEADRDVIYDESRVPAYDLPPLLVMDEGSPVTTPEQWRTRRRPEIFSLFANLVYGRVPPPAEPLQTRFAVLRTVSGFLDGLAVRKEVRLEFRNSRGALDMLVLVFVPKHAAGPVPAILVHSFDDTRSPAFQPHPARPGMLRNGWPLGALIRRGFGLVAVYQQDLVGHNEVEFLHTIHALFYPPGQSFPKANEWGVLGAVAWGGSRALDYLEQDPDIDARRVAVMGHSKMGKAALWTAASDERFAMAISVQSGCAGAALWRRRYGETLEKMVTRFPYWLCRNAWKFAGREDDLPVDQHMLLALVAPRPLYVCSAAEDHWADPRGEYLSAWHAGEVYRLLGRRALPSPEPPPLMEPILDRDVGYHIRKGGHSVDPYDWEQILTFASRHLKPVTVSSPGLPENSR